MLRMRFLKGLLRRLLSRSDETDEMLVASRDMSLEHYYSEMDSYIKILQELRESREHPMLTDLVTRGYFSHVVCRLLKEVNKIKTDLSRRELYHLETRQRELANQYEWVFGKSA